MSDFTEQDLSTTSPLVLSLDTPTASANLPATDEVAEAAMFGYPGASHTESQFPEPFDYYDLDDDLDDDLDFEAPDDEPEEELPSKLNQSPGLTRTN
jgi:hypothetical protein